MQDIARDEWHFGGVFISDCGGEQNADLSVLAGNDLAMPSMGAGLDSYYADLVRGKMSLSYAKQIALRVLQVAGTSRYYHPATARQLNQVADRLAYAQQIDSQINRYPKATASGIAALAQQIAAATDYLNFESSDVLLHFSAYNPFRLQQLTAATGEIRAAMALNEPDGGSDLQNMRSTPSGRRRVRGERVQVLDHELASCGRHCPTVQDRSVRGAPSHGDESAVGRARHTGSGDLP